MTADRFDVGRWRRGWSCPRSLRSRVTAVAVALVVAVLAVVSVGLLAAQWTLLAGGLDDLLARAAATLDEDGAGIDGDPFGDETFDGDEFAWQVVGPDGGVVAGSPALRGAGPVAAAEPGRRTVGEDDLPGDLDGPLRVVTVQATGRGDAAVIHVVGSLEDVVEATEVLAASLAVAVPLAAAALAWVLWRMVGGALQPVEDIRREVAGIGAGGLGRRVPVPPDDDEISRLARTMNRMLDRVEDAVDAQRRFVADASHELRSPLTRIRSQLEVARRGDDVAALRASLLADAGELGGLVDDLLFLARSDDPSVPRREELVDLDEVVLEEVARARTAGAPRVRIDITDVGAVSVRGDTPALGRAVRNLVDNARRHATDLVRVVLDEHDGRARLVVADDGPGIPAEERERVFDRFTRLDDARTRDAGGAGLGLAIVREVVTRHGGTVRVQPPGDDHGGRGARLVVELPLARRADAR